MKEEIKFINYRRYILIFVILGLFSLILNLMFLISPVFATYFADNIGTRIRLINGALYSKFPITAYEFFFFMIITILVFSLGRILVYYFKYRKTQLQFKITYRFKKTLLNYACFSLIIFLVITTNYFVNYHRIDFFTCNNLSETAYNVEELKEKAIIYGNYEITTPTETAKIAVAAMEALSIKYPCLGKHFFAPKENLFFNSFMSPITTEVGFQYSKDVLFPYELCKLLAKQTGFIRDEDAKEIAFECCLISGNNYFIYSGYMGKIKEL